MSYIALYRKFRPQKFEDVIGQEHITKTLKNQIQNNRIGHAYLFSGGRGSGKTSTAKILARAVNCLNPQNGEPCNECEICKQALEGSAVDITEMDAASNNGVDNIRDIREEVEFIPTNAKYRVYIIDEVHMLTTGAFNALLKTLEEPPAHVIFILATTEPQKLPTTILSRCQRFDFKRISHSNIIKRLKYISEQKSINIEDDALRLIANLADGAMRDAISILDRCIVDSEDIISAQKVRELAGIPNFEYLINIFRAIINNSPEEILKLTQTIIDDGKDVSIFIWELIKLIKNILIMLVCGDINSYNEEEKTAIKDNLKNASKEDLINLINELSELESNMKWATEKNIIFQTGLIKICLKKESKIIQNNINYQKTNLLKENQKENNNNTEDLKNKILTKLKENGKMLLHTKLIDTKMIQDETGIIQIIFEKPVDTFSKGTLQSIEAKMAIKEAVMLALGKEASVKYVNLKDN